MGVQEVKLLRQVSIAHHLSSPVVEGAGAERSGWRQGEELRRASPEARFLTGHRKVLVHKLGIGDPCYRFIHVVANRKIHSFLWLSNIPFMSLSLFLSLSLQIYHNF